MIQVTVFVQGWATYGKGVVEKLRSRTFYPKQVCFDFLINKAGPVHVYTPIQLEKINWEMGLQMAQAATTKMKTPNALFELVIQDKEVGSCIISTKLCLHCLAN